MHGIRNTVGDPDNWVSPPSEEGLIEVTVKVKLDESVKQDRTAHDLEVIAEDWVATILPSPSFSVIGRPKARAL